MCQWIKEELCFFLLDFLYKIPRVFWQMAIFCMMDSEFLIETNHETNMFFIAYTDTA